MFVETEEYASDLARDEPLREGQAYARVTTGSPTTRTSIRDGTKLQSAETATTVRLDRGEPVITDGPFVEGKEIVSGFAEIEVADLDEALRMVQAWPGCPVVEIRPVEFETMGAERPRP